MANEKDVCTLCGQIISDLKCIIQCSSCKMLYHNSCGGIVDMRGFHMRRASWKCRKCMEIKNCNEAGITDPKPGASALELCDQTISKLDLSIDADNPLGELCNTVKLLYIKIEDMNLNIQQILRENQELKNEIKFLVHRPSQSCRCNEGELDRGTVQSEQEINKITRVQPVLQPANEIMLNKTDKGLQKVNNKVTRVKVAAAVHQAVTQLKCNDLISLNNPSINTVHTKPNAKKGDWTTVVKSKRTKNTTVIGKCEDATLRTVPQSISLHVYRLHPDTTLEDVSKFLRPKFPEVKCEALLSKYPESYASFKVDIYKDNFVKAMDPAQWPAVGHASVDAVLDKSASLPCDVDPYLSGDRVYMVLWYRDKQTKPIYSFDVRGRAFSKALHWSDPKIFGPRAYFVTVSKPASLNLDGVQLDDEGVYRCRVDFRTSPTRNFAINLTVIVPPYQLILFDNSGRNITGTVGPLEEGSDLVLTCEVRGGHPTPTVSWFVNDRLVEGELGTAGSYLVSRLAVPHVTRAQLNSSYKCQASNTKLMMPIERTVRLEMLLKPLSTKILEKPREMIADQDYLIRCEVEGSRPRAVITWTRDNRVFRRGKIEENGNETVVTSSVTFAPVPEDDGTFLKCVGDNPQLPTAGQEDSFKLNVVYPPQVTLHLGNTLNPEDIKEGDDVYFECNIRANPKQHKITWFHDGILVSQNMSSGVIISTHSLVLQRVTKWQSGAYTCLAVNPRGETMSKPVVLRVRFAPVCRDSEMTVIGASLDEVLKVRCHVAADPSDVTFVWQFNNSGESFDVSPTHFATTTSNMSELMYIPASPRDYGTLTCWGSNSIGRQTEPCLFQVVPASKPSPLSNCTLRTATNHTSDALEVECRAGYDGGLPQRFILEAYDSYTMRMRLNLSSTNTEYPTFRLELGELLLPNGDNLPPTLRIHIYAQNGKGRSEKVVLEDITLNDAEKRTDGSTTISILPLAALLTGALLTVGIGVLLIIVLAIRRRHRHCAGAHCNYQIDTSKQPKITPQTSRPGSMLEINTGDHRYVVAYTLKPATDCTSPITANTDHQPDILNTPRGNDSTTPPSAGGPLPRPDALFTPPGERSRYNSTFGNYSHVTEASTSPREVCGSQTSTTLGRVRSRSSREAAPFSSFATMRRDHIIADSIPGPESCV